MGISIQHNMGMLNANRQLNINTSKKAKSAEKLTSGYRINRAADDAAGLSISEKMRWMVRGLNQGTENAQDGVSWVQIGDGSLEEAHAMLHRMTELAIRASNGTNTDADRAMMQAEFDQLQKEIDRLTDTTQFNTKDIFKDHEYPYYQIEGATRWPQNMMHKVRNGENDLVITYRIQENNAPTTATITVPAGEYTTKELLDEIDTALENAGLLKEGLAFEYTQTGFCNLNLEGGEKIDEVSGGLSYLLFDNYGGGDLGALIGTTMFRNENSGITVDDDRNDQISFKLIDPEDDTNPQSVTLDLQGGAFYTKSELMEMLKEELIRMGVNTETDEVVKVDHYGENIMMSSERYIISEFKGNMFEIDDDANFTSIFYDNIHHVDNITYLPAQFQGAGVLQVNKAGYGIYDEEATVFHFKEGVNNLLVLDPNGTGEITFDLTNLDGNGKSLDGMDMPQVCQALNDELASRYGNDAPVKFEAVMPSTISYADYTAVKDNQGNTKYVGYAAMRIVTKEAEPGKKVGVNVTKSTAYTTLFTFRNQTTYQNDAIFGGNDGIPDSKAILTGGKSLTGGLKITDDNNTFHINIARSDGQPGLSADITLENSIGSYSLTGLQDQIQKQLNEAFKDAPADMKDSQGRVIVVSNDGSHIVLTGATFRTQSIRVSEVAGDKGYTDIFPDEKLIPNREPETGRTETITLVPPLEGAQITADGKVTIPSARDGSLVVWVDGGRVAPTDTNFNLYTGAPNGDGKWDSLQQLEEYINKNLGPKVELNQFNPLDVKGTKDTVTPPVTQNGKGTQSTSVPNNYTGRGDAAWSGLQGEGGELLSNTGPTVKLQKALVLSADNPLKFTSLDFTITTRNSQKKNYTVSLNKEYTDLDTLKNDLQTEINNKVGKNPNEIGGIEVKKTGQTLEFVMNVGGPADTGRLIGTETYLALDTSSEFLRDLHTTKTAGRIIVGAQETKSGYSSQIRPVNASFTPSGGASLKFTVKTPADSGKPVTVDLTNGTVYTRDSLLAAINNKLNTEGYTATYDSYNRLVITGDQKHAGTGYEITLDGSSTALKYMFGYSDQSYSYDNNKAASGTILLATQSAFTLKADDNRKFSIKVDGTTYNITLDEGDYGTAAGKLNIAKEIAKKVNAAAGKQVLNVDKSTLDSSRRIYLETTSKNGWNETMKTGSRIEVSYDRDSAMPKIFGSRQTAGAEAKFVPTDASDGSAGQRPPYKLQLTRVIDKNSPDPTYAGSRSIQVISDMVDENQHSIAYQGGSFIYSDKNDAEPTHQDGHESTMHSFMQGVDLQDKINPNGKVEIDQYNNILTFWYSENYGEGTTYQEITVDVLSPDKESEEFTVSGLINRLQARLNEKTKELGLGNEQKFNVKLEEGNIRIETANTGRKFRICPTVQNGTAAARQYNPSGGFFDKILCSGSTTKVGTKIAWDKAGSIEGGEVYAVGRQDMKNKVVRIQKDGNDTLSLEFTVPIPNSSQTETKTLKMTLDPGYYQGDALVKQIQGKLDEALVDAGLPAGLIEAGIGTVENKVEIVGSLNDRALTFKLSDKVKGPAMGAYGIEAIGGTAAFSVFYATEGDIARAYIMGGKDISGGIEIKKGATDFSVDVDGETYKVELTPGKYTADELVDHINTLFKNHAPDKVPLKATNDGGHLKLMHTKYGKHKISNLKGRVKEQLFFAEKGAKTTEDPIHLRLSGVSGDWTDVERPWMNTVSLGINSLTISKYKYAQKAIGHLKEAVTRVSNIRSYFGAKQNQLESTIRNNENKAENTAAAESRIRDTDISKEVLENSIHNILEQTGVSVMTQAKQNAQFALQLLS